MPPEYSAEAIRQFFDEYGEREWGRLAQSPERVVNFRVHQSLLERYVKPGDSVLEAGAGPGRFTIELAHLGARVTVGDISPRQLELNRIKVQEAGCEGQVAARGLLDIVDLRQFSSAAFDAVVCYGGPLSYVFDHVDQALSELLRVTKPGGYLLFSVMSLLGTTRGALPPILELARQHGVEPIHQVSTTGNLLGDLNHGHRCHMFRWSELQGILSHHPCQIEAAAASGYLAVGHDEALHRVMTEEPELWARFLEWELAYCQEPGAVDGGTHLIVVVRKESESLPTSFT